MNKSKLLFTVIIFLTSIIFFGCSGRSRSGTSDTNTTTPPVIASSLESIVITPANPTIAKTFSRQFTATGTYADGTTQDVTASVNWTSSDSTVAAINTAGLAKGVGAGTTTITATLGTISDSTTLTVSASSSPSLVSIAVTPANPSIIKDATQQFTATGTYSDNSIQDITASVPWTSSDTAIATINAGGLATGISGGTSTITATHGTLSGSTTLTVNTSTNASLVSISITPATATIAKSATQQFTAIGTYSDGTTQNITTSVIWASDTTAVATIDLSGLATGVSPGKANITAAFGTIASPAAVLTVSGIDTPSLVSISVTPATASIAKGATQQFMATGTYSDGTHKDITTSVTWASSDTTVATINLHGLATGKGAGKSTITATLGATSGSAKLTVTTNIGGEDSFI